MESAALARKRGIKKGKKESVKKKEPVDAKRDAKPFTTPEGGCCQSQKSQKRGGGGEPGGLLVSYYRKRVGKAGLEKRNRLGENQALFSSWYTKKRLSEEKRGNPKKHIDRGRD